MKKHLLMLVALLATSNGFIYSQTAVTKPINDDCDAAIAVPVNTTKDLVVKASGNTLGATSSLPNFSPACQGSADDDVWFSFVATANTHIISLQNITGTATDLSHTLYSGTDCGTMTQLYCSDPNVTLVNNLIPGNTYKIRIYTNSSGTEYSAAFDVYITTPPPVTNDECTSAIALTVNNDLTYNTSTSGTLTIASASVQPNVCIGQADDDVWYKFVATSTTQNISLSNLSGNTNNLNHAIYTGNCSALSLKYCSATNSLSSSAKDFVIGETYYIRVWSNAAIPLISDFSIRVGYVKPPVTASTTTYTKEQLVKNVLVNNPCVAISNIKSSTGVNSSVNGIGSFDGSKSEFPISKGLVLSTGNALSISGPNLTSLSEGGPYWPGDTQLESIITAATGETMLSKNASILEFDFTSMNEYMSFNYLFASEEYAVYQCAYGDAFAFLLTDMSTNVTTNLAVVPGTTTPVSVVTIKDTKYNGGCTSANPAYFGNFYGYNGIDPTYAPINFNGSTKLMTASSPIIPNHPYHIKLVIADRGDSSFDSAVFIQGGSFTSGPPECMDRIKLVAFTDVNNNGVQDMGENNFYYGSFVIKKNNTGEPTTISASNGSYSLYDSETANVYDFSFQINPEYAAYYSAAMTNFNDINIPAGSGPHTLYFPITVTQAYKDVSVTVTPVNEPVPGLNYINKVIYKNSGTIPASGTIAFIKPDASAITDIGQSGTVQNANGFTYDFTALAPNETRTFDVTMSVPETVNIGDILTCSATISAVASKGIETAVTSVNSQTVVTSFASSRISESHTQKIPFKSFTANDYLTYTIRFQNVGTANAMTVRIEDLLNSKVDIKSLRMISASHKYVSEIVGNKIVWHMDYINLVGAPQNEELSKGYITFKVKLLPGFTAGDIIPNHADIYFDSNDAVTTNSYNTEFTAALGVETFEAEDIQLFPNPASDMVNVRLQNSIDTLDSITIYDLTGKMIEKVSGIAANQSSLSVGSLAKGMYFVEITTESKMKTTKKLIVN